ncbi:MAG: 4-hydroxy-tetrahydrodipicolinate synthase [Kiritimatiellae bacterium]|nr:4-hydroxy-tetrahydrodipicolinate synthase [Kiritimatiellia bacterium]
MLKGTYTAIVTPFAADGSVDYDTFKKLVEFQIEGGVDGIVPVGTTGESPTLNVDEHLKVIATTVELCKGVDNVIVVAGTGANSTSEAIELTKRAADIGIDGTLQVTPYYNKPSRQGLFEHFSAVAEVGVPVVLYNVPGRSGIPIPVDVVADLAANPNIVAIKEAGGSVERVSAILDLCDIAVVSGDDSLALPMMVVGAQGVISVASNIIPDKVSSMINAANSGDWEKAREMHKKYYSLFSGMFIDTNPVPVKAAMAMMGLCLEEYRLPICAMSDELKTKLSAILSSVDVLKGDA